MKEKVSNFFRWAWENAFLKHTRKWFLFILSICLVIIVIAGWNMNYEKGKGFGCSSPGLKDIKIPLMGNSPQSSPIPPIPSKLPVMP